MTDCFCHPTTTSMRSACSFEASSTTNSTIGLPLSSNITFATSGFFIRVPLPAARMITASFPDFAGSVMRRRRQCNERVVDQPRRPDAHGKRNQHRLSGGERRFFFQVYRVGYGNIIDERGGLRGNNL